MTHLPVLEQPRTFPPKTFLIVIWSLTLLIALYGAIATPGYAASFFVWVAIAVVGFWQLWCLRWFQLDSEGIRMRNIFQRGRSLRWEEITSFREEEVRLSKHPYVVLHLSNQGAATGGRVTKIAVTNDQIAFETLRTIVREAVPRA
jgi:hypothetical protein